MTQPNETAESLGALPSKDYYDVIVIGAGPAGCAASAVAARNGLDVLHVERDREPRFKVGESLMPETYWAFERMGALQEMKQSGFVKKHSVQFYARSGRASAPFYFKNERDHECSQTWQVHRADFDEMLFQNSAKHGAECLRGVNVREILFEGDQAKGVRVVLPDGSDDQNIACKVVIDATGQSSLLAKKVDLGRVDYGLQHASIFTHFKGAYRDQGIDEGATLILQTVPDGDSWFWYIPLAGDVVSVGVVGEVGAMKRPGNKPHETFFEEVKKCPEIERRISGGIQCRPVQVAKDFSYKYEKMAGDGWILIGDAFSFIDPVYSSGVFLALHSGVMAADASLEAIKNDQLDAATLGAFRPKLQSGVDAILGLVRAFYSRDFSFGGFLKRHPEHQSGVTRILIGDVFDDGFEKLFSDMEAMASGSGSMTA